MWRPALVLALAALAIGCSGSQAVDAGGPSSPQDSGSQQNAAVLDAEASTADAEASTAQDASLENDSRPSDGEAASQQDARGANDGGGNCIAGCSRWPTACTAPDPPVQWRCTGPGINVVNPFMEAGCTLQPINSVAWCCPSTFLSQCVCTPTQDWTCNDNPAISSIHGQCLPNGTCSCNAGSALNPATGRCQ